MKNNDQVKEETISISFALPKEIALKFLKVSESLGKSIEDVFLENFGLKAWNSKDFKFRIAKRDKILIPIVWNMYNEIKLLLTITRENLKECPENKTAMYKQLLAMSKSIETVLETLVETIEEGSGHTLTEEEVNTASDFSELLMAIYMSMMKNPKKINQFKEILSNEFEISLNE